MSSARTRWSLAIIAAIISTFVILECGSCGDGGSGDAAVDGPRDIGLTDVMSEHVLDGSIVDADADEGCPASVIPTADCKLPQIAENCDAGWCLVPHGCFVMGSPPCEFSRGLFDEDQVQVTLTHDIEVQQTEFTQGEWLAMGVANPSTQKLDAGDAGFTCANYGDAIGAQYPVGDVTAEEAMSAANYLSEHHQPPLSDCYALTGCTGTLGVGMSCSGRAITSTTVYDCTGYRLPSEAEWEYFTRAGTGTAIYSGDIVHIAGCVDDPNMDHIGWYCLNASCFSQIVAKKKPNGFGLYDVSGNVNEYTSSGLTANGYGAGPLVDPMGQLGANPLVSRGGLANFDTRVARSASRVGYRDYGTRGPLGGFRLVRTLGAGDAGVQDSGTD